MGMEPAPARVMTIEPCPTIQQGPGRVVLTTVNHLNQFLFDLTLRDESGQRETLGVTGWHKLYSESRDDWVSTSTLQVGEQLRGADGSLTVESLVRKPGTFRVYNMTVEGEHVYYVSDLDVLGHNVDCTKGVYEAVDETGKTTIYVGITNDFDRRAGEHAPRFKIRPIAGLQGLSPADAKAVEQALIEYHKLGKNGGTLLNKINSIAKSNPAYANSIRRGTELLHNAGYAGF